MRRLLVTLLLVAGPALGQARRLSTAACRLDGGAGCGGAQTITSPWTLTDVANSGSTTFQFGNSLFGVATPELEITNTNAPSGGFKWNVLALRAGSESQYTGMTLRSPDKRERGAFGYGNTGTDAPFLGTTYIEASFFPMSGTTVPPNLLFAQTGYMGGSNGSRKRLEFQGSDGIIHFYKTDGTTKMLSLDTANNYFAVGTGGSFATNVNGMTFGALGAQQMAIVSTTDNAGIRLDANGSSKVPFVDLYYNGAKKGNIAYTNTAPVHMFINDSGTNTTVCDSGCVFGVGTSATTYKDTNAGGSNTGVLMVAPTQGAGRFVVDMNQGSATTTEVGINVAVNNTSSALIRTTAMVGSSPVRTAGSETGRLEVQMKPAAAGVTAVSRWDGATLHQEFTGTAPAVSSCGGSPSIVGNDHSGKVTIGSAPGASCTLTFSKGWSNAPPCVANNNTTSNLVRSSTSTTVLTLTGTLTAADVISYVCVGWY